MTPSLQTLLWKRLRAKQSYHRIARELGLSRSTVAWWAVAFGFDAACKLGDPCVIPGRFPTTAAVRAYLAGRRQLAELAPDPEIDDATSECDGCAAIIPGRSRDCGCGLGLPGGRQR